MTQSQVVFPGRFVRPARYYTTGRPAYPKLLAQRVADLVKLGAHGRVLDLGAGPGFLALDFAPLAAAVTAIDPSDDMLRAARANIERAGARVELIKGSSFELGAHLGNFRLVTIGRAFHWMERDLTLQALDALLERGGAVALFGERYPEVPENQWHAEFQALIDGYSTDDPARSRIRDSASNETIFLRSAFAHLERVSVLERRATPVERFVDRALSFGAAWDGRPGSREDDLAGEIRQLISVHADAAGNVRELVEGHALIGFRERDLAT